MRCPLPIDWLEYLEGGGTKELTAHLRECQPCRLLVDELRKDATNREPLRLSNPPADKWPRWHESAPDFVAYGEIWWSARMLNGEVLRRIPLLIMSDLWHEHGDSWCEVVPLSTDVENATALDLLLLAADTDLGLPWRALLRHQTTVRRQELEARIGRLSDTGRSLMDEVVAGRAPENRFGVPVADAYDDRLSAPEDVERVIRFLGRPFAEASEHDDSEAAQDRVVVYKFKRVRPESPNHDMSLAADTTAPERTWPWTVDIPQRGQIRGRIEYQWTNDELSFAIEDIAQEGLGFSTMVWIVASLSKSSGRITSEPFVPEVHKKIVLARDRAVFPREVSGLELILSHES